MTNPILDELLKRYGNLERSRVRGLADCDWEVPKLIKQVELYFEIVKDFQDYLKSNYFTMPLGVRITFEDILKKLSENK